MSNDLVDSVLDLTETMLDTNSIQSRMAKSILDQRAQITSLQFAVLAIAEQLVADGHLDASKAGQRIVDMAKQIDPEKMRDVVRPKAALLAARLDSLGGPVTPRPPRGTKPRVVK